MVIEVGHFLVQPYSIQLLACDTTSLLNMLYCLLKYYFENPASAGDIQHCNWTVPEYFVYAVIQSSHKRV